MRQIFQPDDPLVVDGTYDIWGFNKKERAAKARQEVREMKAKKKATPRVKRGTMKASKPTSQRRAPATVPRVRHRTNIIKGNGGLSTSREVAPAKVPIGEAMRRAVQDLGEVVIDDKVAPQQLRELADCYEDVTRRAAAWVEQASLCKIAKQSLEGAKDLLLEKVRTFTHPIALPLFDRAEREADQGNMLDAAADAS